MFLKTADQARARVAKLRTKLEAAERRWRSASDFQAGCSHHDSAFYDAKDEKREQMVRASALEGEIKRLEALAAQGDQAVADDEDRRRANLIELFTRCEYDSDGDVQPVLRCFEGGEYLSVLDARTMWACVLAASRLYGYEGAAEVLQAHGQDSQSATELFVNIYYNLDPRLFLDELSSKEIDGLRHKVSSMYTDAKEHGDVLLFDVATGQFVTFDAVMRAAPGEAFIGPW